MSNTSNNKAANSKPTKSKDKDKLRVIVGEIGRDSKTGILGRGYSPDNGKTFHVTETMYGRLYNSNDIDAIWNNGTSEKVKSEVNSATAEIPAVKSAADEAVKKADSAIASSKVNSDAIVAQSEAISEAKSAISSATAEIQQTAATAASDAAKIRADLAQVQNEVDTAKAANSASVEALKSDIDTAKQDLANMHDSLTKAQSAVEQNQKLINDSVAKISNDIAQDRKDLATAQQNNADLAKQLDDYSKQAEVQGKTIKSIQNDQNGFTATLADVKGNVTQISDKVDGLSAGLKDAQGNIASVKAQADQLNVTLSDHGKNIAQLTATAKELSSTLEDADGRLSKVEQTTQTNSSTLSDVQGDLSQVKQTADGLVTTLKDAKGNIDQLQQTAKGTAEQISNVQGDITNLQKDVNGIKLTIADHDKNIHTLQADSKTLKDDMADAKGNISSLQKTATSLDSEFKDHDGRISKVEQTASKLTNEFSDQQGHLNRVEQTAQSTQQTVADQQGQLNDIKTDISGVHETITGQGNQIATINTSLNGLNTKYESVSEDLGKLSDKVTTNSTQITQNKKEIDLKADQSTVDNLTGEVSQNSAQLKVQADQISSKVSSTDFKTLNDKVNGMQIGTSNLLHHSDTFDGWSRQSTVTISSEKYLNGNIAVLATNGSGSNSLYSFLDGPYDDQPVTWTVWAKADNAGDRLHTELWGGGGFTDQPLTTNWKLYKFTGHRNINYHDLFFWGVAGNKGNIYVALPFAVVGNTVGTWSPNPSDTITATQNNSTAIDQTNQKISLKADQTEVDQIKNTASQNSSRLDVMAGQISSKVTATDVNNIVDSKGYATTSSVQSMITQSAGSINETITNLTNSFNSLQVGGRNLLHGTSDQWRTLTNDGYWLQKTTASTCWTSTVDYHTGNTFTYAAKITNNSHQQAELEVWLCDQNKTWINGQAFHAPIPKGANAYDVSVTFPITANTWYIRSWVIFTGGNAPNGDSVQVKDERLVEGNLAMDWTPAPEDMATVMQIQQVTATVDGLTSTVANKADTSQITQLSNLIQSKVSSNDFTSKISQLSNDINARVSKGDLISQLNMEAGQTLIQSNKLFLDADTIVFSKNSKAFIPDAAIENLSLDKLTTGHITVPIADKYGNQIELGNDGINVSSALEPIDWSGSGTGYQDDKSRFNFNVSSHGMSFTNHIEYGKSTVKTHASDDYQFLNLTPDVLHYTNGSTDQVKVPSGMTMYVPVNATSTLGPKSPGGFFAIGHEQIGDNGATSDKTIDIAYVAKQINGWKQGLHVNTTIYSKPAGASHNMRTAWVSWSQWDAGEHYPAIISDGKWWGGICFPSTGKVTLFDPYGHAMWLTQGNAPYSAWGDDYDS